MRSAAGSLNVLGMVFALEKRAVATRRAALLGSASLMTPALLGLSACVFVPAAAAFVIALYDWQPLSGRAEYVGLANLWALLTDPEVGSALGNTARYTLVVIPGALAMGLLAALALRAVRRGAGMHKALYFFPVAATLAASCVAWRWSFQPGGQLDPLARWLGFDSWLADPSSGLIALALVGVWRESAFAMVLFAAALASVPPEQVDAARIDGARAWGAFTAVLWPALRPGLVAAIVLITESSGGLFDPVLIITGGGPAGGTKTLGYLLWERSVRFQDYDAGAVIGLVLLVYLLAVTGLQLFLVRGRRWT
jgi:ABC-type sugar transport system permease subunit